jgi:cell wall-associated NlpC family hydrolase
MVVIRANLLLVPLIVGLAMSSAGCLTPSVRYTRPTLQDEPAVLPPPHARRPAKEKAPAVKAGRAERKTRTAAVVYDTLLDFGEAFESDAQTGSSSPSGPLNDRLMEIINSYIGVPYRYGGTTRSGLDCSGLVQNVFRDVYELDLPRASKDMYKLGTWVRRKQAQPGDLVFFDRRGRVNHVGIYVGDGRFAHASPDYGVTYSTLDNEYFTRHFAGIKRLF